MQVLEELKRIDDERFLAIYEALSQQGYGPLDGEVAKALKFRPLAIKKLPMAQRARRGKALLLARHNSELCYEIFGTYLLREHKELVTEFLDATGVRHKDGLLEDLDHNQPAQERIGGAVAQLDQKFDREDVTLYLALCAQQWPSIEALAELWRRRA
jgi:hypothetical protein